jgi:hypothetical protein
VFVGYSLAQPETPATTTVATTTTTIAQETGAPGELPEGYVAVGDRLGMRIERILQRSDGVFITVTTVVKNSLDPDTTTGFQGGVWTMVLADGRRITSTNESFDPLARGTVSIHFPPDGIVPEDIETLELNGLADRLTTVIDDETVEPVLLGEDPTDLALVDGGYDIDAGVVLSVDSFNLSTESGLLEWSVESDALAFASVVPELTLTDPAGTEILMTTRVQTTGFRFFHPSVASTPLTADGVDAFDPPNPGALDAGPWTASLALQVTWATYDPILVNLPVDDVPIAVITG